MARLAVSRAGRIAEAFEEAQGEYSQAINSSAMTQAAYHDQDQTLDITFIRGRTYTYYGVPFSIYQGLINAPSAGRFFNANIRDHYRFS